MIRPKLNAEQRLAKMAKRFMRKHRDTKQLLRGMEIAIERLAKLSVGAKLRPAELLSALEIRDSVLRDCGLNPDGTSIKTEQP